MALPFTDEQRIRIRERLIESAQRHAIAEGVAKTSLEMLTSEAGISKSSFYKFYDSKEQLFLEVASYFEADILDVAMTALSSNQDAANKERTAAFVYKAFERIHQLGIVRFLREDLPYLCAFFPPEAVRKHYLRSAQGIFDLLCQANIQFTESEDIVLSAIQLMYLSILNISDIGDSFFPALQILVHGACNKLVA